MRSNVILSRGTNSTMTDEGVKVTLKLLVDNENKRVVFAEADKDFIDILFSFLTLPLGTIIRRLDKQSVLGSLSNLYDSVESLDAAKYLLQTEACKMMLLRPQSAAAYRCEDLKLNVDDVKPREVFVCKNYDCCAKPICFGSPVENTQCPHCQLLMDSTKIWGKRDEDSVHKADGDGVFVKGGVTFLISDDLHVMPSSLTRILSLLNKSGLQDVAVLEERTLDLGTEEITDLLRRSLISKAPLTGICFNNKELVNGAVGDIVTSNMINIKTEGNLVTVTDESQETISLKLLVSRADNKVLCAEAGEDFADLVLSFLTLPLGCVIKLVGTNSSMGCVDNLYRSVQDFGVDYVKSDECKDMLRSPKLAPFFGCDNLLLKIDEMSPRESNLEGRCHTCYWEKNACKHGVEKAVFMQLNPKSPSGKTETGGGYAKGPGKYMVTDDLRISPLTPISTAQVIKSQGSPLRKLVERDVRIDHVEALKLLRAALISETPLSDIFCTDQKRRKMMRSVAYHL